METRTGASRAFQVMERAASGSGPRVGPFGKVTAVRRLVLVCFLVALLPATSSCRRRLEVPEATYRETVTAFYTAVAAMQTSQEVLARRELERVTELVPGEPAGWANLGLLLMRQQELDAAAPKLAKAAELAPKSAPVQRLLALPREPAGPPAGGDSALEERCRAGPERPQGALRARRRPRAPGRRRTAPPRPSACSRRFSRGQRTWPRALELAAPRGQAWRRRRAPEGHGSSRRGEALLAGAGPGAARGAAEGGLRSERRRHPRGVPQERPAARARVPQRARRREHASKRGRRAPREVPRPSEP